MSLACECQESEENGISKHLDYCLQREAYQQLTIMAQGTVEINSLAEHGIQDSSESNLF